MVISERSVGLQASLENIIEYICVGAIILQCNSVFMQENNHYKNLILIISIIGLFVLFFKSWVYFVRNRVDLRPLLKFTFFYVLTIGLYLFISNLNYPIYKSLLIYWVFAPILAISFFYYCSLEQRINRLFFRFENIVLILAILSLFFWFLAELGYPTNVTKTIDWGSVKEISGYFNLHFIAQGSVNFLGMILIRNTGIFVEAPMYSYVLTSALLVELFLRDKKKLMDWKFLILFFTILSTTSTTGVLMVIVAVSYYEFVVLEKFSATVRFIVLICTLPILFTVIKYLILKKVDTAWYSSSSIRLNDFVAGFNAWRQHIWIGNGFGNYASILNQMDYRRLAFGANSGFSSGFMVTLAYGGILGALAYIVPTFSMVKVSKKDFGLAICSFILFVLTLINGVLLYVLFLSYFWVKCFPKEK